MRNSDLRKFRKCKDVFIIHRRCIRKITNTAYLVSRRPLFKKLLTVTDIIQKKKHICYCLGYEGTTGAELVFLRAIVIY